MFVGAQLVDNKSKPSYKYNDGDEINIVHPYFDNPDHYEWTDSELQILIQSKNGSAKGQFSIELFGLAEPLMNELRAQQIRFEELRLNIRFLTKTNKLVHKAIDYKLVSS